MAEVLECPPQLPQDCWLQRCVCCSLFEGTLFKGQQACLNGFINVEVFSRAIVCD